MTTASYLAAILAASLLFPPDNKGESACCDEHQPGQPAHVQHTPPAPTAADLGGNKFATGALRKAPPAAQRRTGQLAIQAIQGTASGPALGELPVEIELYHRGQHIDTIEAGLDKHGVLVLEDVPIAMGIQPLVKIRYQGMTYQQVGDVMEPRRPDQSMKIYCYEPTDEPPPWTVSMRHVVISPAPEGLGVTEVMVVANPTDRTWVGSPPYPGFARDDGEEKEITTIFPLSTEARGVALGRGFHEWCCSTLDGSKLANHLPLTPGKTEMVFGYILPARRGAVTLELIAPAHSEHLLVLIPDNMMTSSAVGLKQSGTDQMGESTMRLYSAASMDAGQSVKLTLTRLGDGQGQASAGIARISAIVGGGLILLIAIVIVFARPKPSSSAPVAPVDAQ